MLRESIASDIAVLDTGLVDWNVDPIDGVPAMLLQLPDYQRVEGPDDGRRMVDRWRAMAVHIDQHLDNLRRSLADGRVASRPPVERTIAILDDLLVDPIAAWPLLGPLRAVADLPGWSTSDRERFGADLTAVVDDEIRPAFVRLRDALVDEVLPQPVRPTAPAWASSPEAPMATAA